MLCTHQAVQQNFSVRSKSYSAVYFDSRGYFVFMDLYSTAVVIFYVMAVFCICFWKMPECKKYISFMMKKSEKYKKQKKYIDKTKRVL